MAKKKKPKAKSKPKAKKKPVKKAVKKRLAAKKNKGGRKPFPKDKVRNELVTIKVSIPELNQLFGKADKLAEGNTSALLRHAFKTFKGKVPKGA